MLNADDDAPAALYCLGKFFVGAGSFGVCVAEYHVHDYGTSAGSSEAVDHCGVERAIERLVLGLMEIEIRFFVEIDNDCLVRRNLVQTENVQQIVTEINQPRAKCEFVQKPSERR